MLAVFHNHGCHPLDGFLKKGFKHVYVCAQANGHWIRIDARRGVPLVEIVAQKDFDLEGFYESQGFTVVRTNRERLAQRWPLILNNCVGMAKAILGIRSFAVTPYQLYKHMLKGEK